MPNAKQRSLLSKITTIKLGVVILSFPFASHAAEDHQYNIPAGTLDSALNHFAVESGIEFYLDSSLSSELYSQGLVGQYDNEQALSMLLTNTGLQAQKQSDGVYYLVPTTDSMTLDAIHVRTHFDDAYQRDTDGEMDVYDKDIATAYLGKEEIERFKGTSAQICLPVSPTHTVAKHEMAVAVSTRMFVVYKALDVYLLLSMVLNKVFQCITATVGHRTETTLTPTSSVV